MYFFLLGNLKVKMYAMQAKSGYMRCLVHKPISQQDAVCPYKLCPPGRTEEVASRISHAPIEFFYQRTPSSLLIKKKPLNLYYKVQIRVNR